VPLVHPSGQAQKSDALYQFAEVVITMMLASTRDSDAGGTPLAMASLKSAAAAA
jgi:hypothetical protein